MIAVNTDHFPGRLNLDDPSHDDFELWSPSEDREEQCLFGAQVGSDLKSRYVSDPPLQSFYYRRKREANCYVGELDKPPETIQDTCTCTEEDFEWYCAIIKLEFVLTPV